MIRLILNGPMHESDDLEMVMEREAAEYIAEVMEAEFDRTADAGAFSMAKRIRQVYAKHDRGRSAAN